MITFSCKKITREELLRCSFNLNRTEYNVLSFMLGNGNVHKISRISKAMGLERTTIQKAIKGLVSRGLVRRLQKNLPRGGYIFLYNVKNKDKIKHNIKEIIYEWYKGVENEIDEL